MPSGPTIYLGDDVIDGDTFQLQAWKAAAGFRAIGVGQGDCIALLMRNDGVFLEATVGAQKIGAYVVPLNWHFKADELLYVLRDSQPKVLVAHADLLPTIAAELPSQMRVVVVPPPAAIARAYGPDRNRRAIPVGLPQWSSWISPQQPIADTNVSAPDSVIYTSGTTGRPKGVRRKPPSSPDQAAANEKMRAAVFDIGAGARVLVSAPLYHTAPNYFSLRAIRYADSLVLATKFEPEPFLALIEKYRITHVYAVPTMFVRLLALDQAIRDKYDLSSLRFVLHAGGPCAPAIKRQMIEWLGPVISEYYGSTEHGPITCCSSEEWLAHPGTVGRAVPGAVIRIEDDEGKPLPTGSAGEILARNTAHADFTYHNRQAERDQLQRGELIMTGDIGYLDADGFLYLCDRKRDVIISGGVNIYPAEIESAIAEFPGVQDSAVFGIPHPEFSETVMAIVQPRAGTELDHTRLLAFLSERLARYKVPSGIEIRHHLPREESGKIRKRTLRAPFWENHDAHSIQRHSNPDAD